MEQKLLIVDDEAHIRMLLEQTLEELEDDGVNFYSASNGEEAYEIIKDRKSATGFPRCDDAKNEWYGSVPQSKKGIGIE